MQTFLPYSDFDASAKALDRARLGKQRVEVLQLLRAASGETRGWRNHPAARMWSGYEYHLIRYGQAVCREWIRRGYKDTCYQKISSFLGTFSCNVLEEPPWLGNYDFHRSHQSNLIRKFSDHYLPQFPGVPDDLPYFWPTLPKDT